MPPVAGCGDGVLAPSEDCDDGNVVAGDGCSPACVLEDKRGLCAGVPTSPATVLTTKLYAAGFTRPVEIAAAPLDPHRLFVVEQGGLVRIVKDGAVLATPFLNLSDRVADWQTQGDERGLLGIAFDPDYRVNRRFFVDYTNQNGDTVVARYLRDSASKDLALKSSEKILFTIAQPFANHNGGHLEFGPDGYLYVGMGDGGSGGDPHGNAQNDNSPLGKMLRADVTPDSAPFYAVPPGNPHSSASGVLALVWAKGFRNPWRFSFDPTADLLVIGDVGQSKREEIDVVDASASGYNFGWDPFEGNSCFEPGPLGIDCNNPPADFTFPVLDYDHSQGHSVTGGYVYRGCALPAVSGTYFYADYSLAFIRSFTIDSTNSAAPSISNARDRTTELDPPGSDSIRKISTFGRDARGEIYIADLSAGKIFQIVAGN